VTAKHKVLEVFSWLNAISSGRSAFPLGWTFAAIARTLPEADISVRYEMILDHGIDRRGSVRIRGIALLLLLGLALPLLGQQNPGKAEVTEAKAEVVQPKVEVAQPKADSVSDGAPGEYTVGAGDVLSINVWKEPELSLDHATIRPDGMISIPLIGAVRVGGMTVSQIQDMLAEKLHRFVSIARVTVTVTDIRSRFVYITGEVNRPGMYPLLASADVLQIIIRAGGLSPFARRKSIFILRNVDGKEQKIPVNYTKLMRGDGVQNVQLQVGDTVVVP